MVFLIIFSVTRLSAPFLGPFSRHDPRVLSQKIAGFFPVNWIHPAEGSPVPMVPGPMGNFVPFLFGSPVGKMTRFLQKNKRIAGFSHTLKEKKTRNSPAPTQVFGNQARRR